MLQLSESHLSHVLKDLDEADLIVRIRGEGKEVALDLGPVGREVVGERLSPRWVGAVAERLDEIRQGKARRMESAELARALAARRAPRLAAERLARALADPLAQEVSYAPPPRAEVESV